MVDYVKLSATALRLISNNGRTVELVRKDQAPGDVTKPWNGPADATDALTTIRAVFVPPNTVRQFGLTALGQGTEFEEMITRSEHIAIVNPEELELRQFIKLKEADGTEWGFTGIQVLKPGDIQLLAFIGVRR